MREVARRPLLSELEDDLLGTIDEIGDLALALLAQPHDLLARADEPAQRRHLLDDARVVLDVRRGGDERRELGDARLPAGGVELGTLLELVDERDRIDRLALRPQRERRAIDLRVALAVEVGCVEDLADRAHRDGREQHRAENRLLGFEVLRWHDGAQALADTVELGATHAAISSEARHALEETGACGEDIVSPGARGSKASVPHGSGVKPSGAAASNRKGRDGSTAYGAGRTEHTFRCYPRPRTACRQVGAGCPPGNMRSERELPRGLHTAVENRGDAERRYDDAVPATTSGRRRRARPIAPETVRCRPSSRNHGLPRLYAFQSATTRLFRQRRAAFRIRAFTCA